MVDHGVRMSGQGSEGVEALCAASGPDESQQGFLDGLFRTRCRSVSKDQVEGFVVLDLFYCAFLDVDAPDDGLQQLLLGLGLTGHGIEVLQARRTLQNGLYGVHISHRVAPFLFLLVYLHGIVRDDIVLVLPEDRSLSVMTTSTTEIRNVPIATLLLFST